jgi:fatty acid desaturase
MLRCFGFVDPVSRHSPRELSHQRSGQRSSQLPGQRPGQLPGQRLGQLLGQLSTRRARQLSGHLLRIAIPLLLLLAFPAIAPVAAIALYLGAFTLTHELAHGALDLPRRRNELALAIAGVCMATSGHALRLMHLRHHADPLGDRDLEGRSARMPAWQALAAAPGLCVLLVVAAWRTATARDRRWQRLEYLTVAVLTGVVLAVGPRALHVYLLAAIAAQALAPFWAGHLPHRTPRWLHALASRLARAGSMTMRTLVVHDAHHRRPKLPTRQLSTE